MTEEKFTILFESQFSVGGNELVFQVKVCVCVCVCVCTLYPKRILTSEYLLIFILEVHSRCISVRGTCL